MALLVGSESLTPNENENEAAGEAFAAEVEAITSGKVESIEMHTSKTTASTGTSVVLGIYSIEGGRPGTLLASGTFTGVPGTNVWISVAGLSVAVVAGTKYFLAGMPLAGTLEIDVTTFGTTGTGHFLGKGWTKLEPGSAFVGENLKRGPVAIVAKGTASASGTLLCMVV